MMLLLALLTSSGSTSFAQKANILEILPSDDAYIVNDLNDPADRLGLRGINTGDYKFLKVWYAWNVTGAENSKIISLAYLNFDLSKLNPNEVHSAVLRMYAQNITFTGSSRFVDIQVANVTNWDESTLTFSTAPGFSVNATASTSISRIGWYEWDLTGAVREKAGSNLTIVVLLHRVFDNAEEQVVFVSKEGDDNSLVPELIVNMVDSSSESYISIQYLLPILSAVIAAGGLAGYVIYAKRVKPKNTS